MPSAAVEPRALPAPTVITDLAAGVWAARLLLTATELDVFGLLAQGALPEEEIGRRLGLHPRPRAHFLAALRAAGLLEMDAEGYRNTPLADAYLVPGRPGYYGGFLQLTERFLNPSWEGLADMLRTGEPRNASAGDPSVETARTGGHVDFLDAMDAFNEGVAARLAARDWSGYRTLVDLGGSRGNLAARIVQANPWLTATVFDLPYVAEPFARHTAGFGPEVAGRMRFIGGDFFVDDLPSADVVIVGHVLHDWAPAKRQELLNRVATAVPAGSTVLVYDQMIDEDRPQLFHSLLSLNMMLRSPGGSEYTRAECERWLTLAGLEVTGAEPLGDTGDTLVSARRLGGTA